MKSIWTQRDEWISENGIRTHYFVTAVAWCNRKRSLHEPLYRSLGNHCDLALPFDPLSAADALSCPKIVTKKRTLLDGQNVLFLVHWLHADSRQICCRIKRSKHPHKRKSSVHRCNSQRECIGTLTKNEKHVKTNGNAGKLKRCRDLKNYKKERILLLWTNTAYSSFSCLVVESSTTHRKCMKIPH